MIDTVTSFAPGVAGGAALIYLYLFGGGSRAGNTSASFSYRIEQSVEVIDAIAKLKDGWAGEGSIAPSAQVVDFSRFVLQRICHQALFMDIAPMPNGTIAFDWETDEGCANLEVGETAYSFYLDLVEDGAFYPMSGSVREIPLWLGDFISEKLMPLVPSATYVRPRVDSTYVSWGPALAYA